VNALDGRPRVGRCLQVKEDVDALDDEDAVFQLDLSPSVRREPTAARIDLARLQRATKGAQQSAACRRDDVVQSRGMGLGRLRRDAVVRRDRAVDAEAHGRLLDREIGEPLRSPHPLDANVRYIDDVAHFLLLS
jgi:hypothetical protein